jgi:hypothetical protein
MSPVALGEYLNNIKSNLHLAKSAEKEIIQEISSHIDDQLDELKDNGLTEEEAIRTCIKLMGSAKTVAQQLYEAHSQGTWKQTLLAASPHLLFAALFALSWWPGIFGWLLLILTLTFGAVIFFWWREKPNWAFSWLGYLLLPVLFAGLALLYLPRGWSWIAVIVYAPLAAFIVYRITVRTIHRDWLYGTLMLLPLPIIIAWFIIVGSENTQSISLDYVEYFGPFIGLSFLILAFSVAIFIRLRQRWLKISLLLVSGILTLSIVAYYTQGRLGLPAFLILLFVVLGLFVTPAALEHKVRKNHT